MIRCDLEAQLAAETSRRSISVKPPQIPKGSLIPIAYSAQGWRTGQTWQIALARSSRRSRSSFRSKVEGGKKRWA